MFKLKYMFRVFVRKRLFSLVILQFCMVSNLISSQNYVGPKNELAIHSTIDLSTSHSWETDKSTTPGFFTWLAGSDNYTGVTDTYHINGYAKKVGNTSFTFPVGSGADLRTLSISAPSSVSSEYAVAWLAGNPGSIPDPSNANALHSITSISGRLTAVSALGQWDWIPVVGDGSGLTVTVSIPALSGPLFTNASNIRLVGWNGSSWVELGTNGATGLSENSQLMGTMIAGIQAIGIGTVESTVVAVLAPSFTVTQDAKGILTVTGTAERNSFVVITFPDGSTAMVVATATGTFGPISSTSPQINKGVVTAIARTQSGVSSEPISVSYDFPPTQIIVAPFFTVVQNSNGLLSVSGTAEKNSSVLITFPDGSTTTVVASATGAFGPVISATPQVNVGFVTAIATASNGMSSRLVVIDYNFPITVLVSEAFTPDGDGINDTWVIYELDKYPNSTVRVYNRWGHLVFSANDYQNDWDGHFKNNSTALPQSGSYYYQIDFRTDGTIDKEGWLYIRK